LQLRLRHAQPASHLRHRERLTVAVVFEEVAGLLHERNRAVGC
jgi:hypothetical protein